MQEIIISMESTCDLSQELIQKYDLSIIDMDFMIENEVYSTKHDNVLSTNLYEKMKEGKKTSTSQINEELYYEYFKNLQSKNKPIIHLCLTKGVSNTYECAIKAANRLNSTNNNIFVIDSLCICSGQGYLGILVREFSLKAQSIEEILQYIESLKTKVNHIFTVDNLKYLANGGRIKASAAFFGNVLNIKPLLKANNNGELVSTDKVISRKKALLKLAEKTLALHDPNFTTCFISHANCLEDVNFLIEQIKLNTKLDVKIENLGPVIGAHAGPGTVAIFFIGKNNQRL